MAKKERKDKKEKPLDKMTATELRKYALDLGEIDGVHGMNKEELLSAIKKVKGIKDEGKAAKTMNVRELKEKAKEARTRMAAAVQRAKASYLHLQEQTVAGAKAAAKKADVVIRDHPYESIGIAFGLGLLIGVLVTRK